MKPETVIWRIGWEGRTIGGCLILEFGWTGMCCWASESCFRQNRERLLVCWYRSKDSRLLRSRGRSRRLWWWRRDIHAVGLEMLGLCIDGLSFTVTQRRRLKGMQMLSLSVVRLSLTAIFILIIQILSMARKRVTDTCNWVLIVIELNFISVLDIVSHGRVIVIGHCTSNIFSICSWIPCFGISWGALIFFLPLVQLALACVM